MTDGSLAAAPGRLRAGRGGAALRVGAVLAVTLLAGICIGETSIPPGTVLRALAGPLMGLPAPDAIEAGIVRAYRLPRTLVAGACGAGLAICGLVLQSLLRNALADPWLLGISAGASTGAVLVTVAGLGAGMVPMGAGALAGAVGAFLLVAGLARLAGAGAQATGQIVLAGIAGSQLFNALTAFIIARSANAEQARGLMFWLLGNLSGVRWPDVHLALPAALVALVVVAAHARSLDAFAFGPEAAAALGVRVGPVRVVLIGVTAMAAAVMVSIAGAIGFVGLVVPHAARMLVGTGHGRLIPASALIGAVFLVGADILSRIVIPGQVLPIGVVTALIGAPIFAVILIRHGGPR